MEPGVLLRLSERLSDPSDLYCWWEKCQGWLCVPPAPAPPFPVGLWGCRRETLQTASSTLTVASSGWGLEGGGEGPPAYFPLGSMRSTMSRQLLACLWGPRSRA